MTMLSETETQQGYREIAAQTFPPVAPSDARTVQTTFSQIKGKLSGKPLHRPARVKLMTAEDRRDLAIADAARAEGGEMVPLEEVRKRLGL